MAHNPSLFLRPEPPDDDRLVRRTFVDREQELDRAKRYVRSALRAGPPKIHAVVGRARVGKSHLLRRLVPEVSRHFDACLRLRVAHAAHDGADVLRALLHDLLHELGGGPDTVVESLAPLQEFTVLFGQLIDGSAAEVEITTGRAELAQLQRRLSFRAPSAACCRSSAPGRSGRARRSGGAGAASARPRARFGCTRSASWSSPISSPRPTCWRGRPIDIGRRSWSSTTSICS